MAWSTEVSDEASDWAQLLEFFFIVHRCHHIIGLLQTNPDQAVKCWKKYQAALFSLTLFLSISSDKDQLTQLFWRYTVRNGFSGGLYSAADS